MKNMFNTTHSFGRALIAALALGFTCSAGFAAESHYYVNDPLATTVAIADSAGEIAAMEADAFGAPLAIGEAPGRFTGKPYDADLGAFVFPFRNYRPEEGRWMSADPSGFPDGMNSIAYLPVPFHQIDPFGLAIIHVNNPTGANGFGQSAAIIGSGSSWTYNSFGNGAAGSSGFGSTPSTLTQTTFTSQQAAINHAAGLGYTRGLSYNTTTAQDTAAQTAVNSFAGTNYHPVNNNCVGMVNTALDAAGIMNHSTLTGPNLNFTESTGVGGARSITITATE